MRSLLDLWNNKMLRLNVTDKYVSFFFNNKNSLISIVFFPLSTLSVAYILQSFMWKEPMLLSIRSFHKREYPIGVPEKMTTLSWPNIFTKLDSLCCEKNFYHLYSSFFTCFYPKFSRVSQSLYDTRLITFAYQHPSYFCWTCSYRFV